MKRVKQINNLIIKERNEGDPYYNLYGEDNNYVVVTLDGRVWEDRLTLAQAEEFCRDTKDFVIKNNK